MSTRKLQIPDGVRDYKGNEAYLKREIESKLRGLFRLSGFEEIETPIFEYDSIFLGEIGNLRQENMLRFFDVDGRTLALRPDFTMPAARLVSARENEFPKPVRVFYIGEAFGFQYNYGLRQRQFTQAGAELIGDGSTMADAEMIMLASQSLEQLGIRDYVLDIGHVGVFTGLAEAAGLSDEQAELLRHCIDGKVIPELHKLTADLGVGNAMAAAFIGLAEMYGKPDILDTAEALFPYEQCVSAITALRGMLEPLKGSQIYEKLTIDLGLLPDINYYTGTVFRGMVDGVSYQLLSGGRYDNVLSQFGKSMPATGFAMGIGWAIEAVEKQGSASHIPQIFAITGAEPGYQGDALAYAWEQRGQGRCVVTSRAADRATLLREARERGAGQAIYFSEAGSEVLDASEEGE